jgi:hypothetical protein
MLSPAVFEIRLALPAIPLAFTSQTFQFLRIASQIMSRALRRLFTRWGDALQGVF